MKKEHAVANGIGLAVFLTGIATIEFLAPLLGYRPLAYLSALLVGAWAADRIDPRH